MPPTVILIRHAQAQHNFNIPDPGLTPLGIQQCSELSDFLQTSFPLTQKISLVVTSPFRRTLQTTTLALSSLISAGVPVILSPDFQENSSKPCDTGSAIPLISKEFPQYSWGDVDPMFPSKKGVYEYSREALLERGRRCRRWLRAREEDVIVVVSHAGFLSKAVCGRQFGNGDVRVWEFGREDETGKGGMAEGKTRPVDEDGKGGKEWNGFKEDGWRFVEWKETEDRGGARGLSHGGWADIDDEPFGEEEVRPGAANGDAVPKDSQ